MQDYLTASGGTDRSPLNQQKLKKRGNGRRQLQWLSSADDNEGRELSSKQRQKHKVS